MRMNDTIISTAVTCFIQDGDDHSTRVSWRAIRKPHTSTIKPSSESTEYSPFQGSGPILPMAAVRQPSAKIRVE